jgi:telomere length regulation protein
MEGLLTTVSRTQRKDTEDTEFLSISKPQKPASVPRLDFKGTSPEEALEVLKNQPDYESLISVLKYLEKGAQNGHQFNLLIPSPQSAQIVHVLVSEVVPNYWALLKEATSGQGRNKDLDTLLHCLLSITGLNATLSFLRALIQEANVGSKTREQSHALFDLSSTLELLSDVLQGDGQAKKIWGGSSSSQVNSAKVRILRREFISLVVGGKVLSLAAEAEAILDKAEKLEHPYWVADGKQYVEWLGRNILSWLTPASPAEDVQLCADILSRALKLGYSGRYSVCKTLQSALLMAYRMDHRAPLDRSATAR